MMTNRFSFGHIFLVQSHNYVPTYFCINEFQLVGDKRDSNLETPASVESNIERDNSLCTDQSAQKTRRSRESVNFWLQDHTEYVNESSTQTTRFLSSTLATLFSCNVSKMSCSAPSKFECDGYFGCPEERPQLQRENATYPRRRRPVCIIPWKKRKPAVRTSTKKKKPPQKPVSNQPDSMDAYYISKVDCVTSTVEKSKVSGIKVRIRPKIQQTQSTKSHPAMFYSYFVAKGFQYRKICAPKKRSCDGYFGCHDESDSVKCKGKPKGKKKQVPTK